MKFLSTFVLLMVIARVAVAAPINGIYGLVGAGGYSTAQLVAIPNTTGVTLRLNWSDIEPVEGQSYNWQTIDSAISTAAAAHKLVAIGIKAGINTPNWVYIKGAAAFPFVWPETTYGPPVCSIVNIPVPWDAVYLAKWQAFINTLGARYDSNPNVSYVYLSGGDNSKTAEALLPREVSQVSINNGQCFSNNDTANWQAIGYTRTLAEDAYMTAASYFAAAFPHHVFSGSFIKVGFPPIDQNGTIIPGATYDALAPTDILASLSATYGVKVGLQNDGLSQTGSPMPVIANYSHADVTGYQEVGPLLNSANVQAALNYATTNNALFVEMYGADMTPANASILQAAQASLKANHVP